MKGARHERSHLYRYALPAHKPIRDPFRLFAWACASKPKPIGLRCQTFRKPVRRVYRAARQTGRVFGYYACACTVLSQQAQLTHATPDEWKAAVTELKRLVNGSAKVRTAWAEDTEVR